MKGLERDESAAESGRQDEWWPVTLLWLLLCVVLVAGIGLVDFLTGDEMAFSVFYLVPVAICAWRYGIRWGLVLSLFCAIIWGAIDHVTAASHRHPGIAVWNAGIGMVSNSVVALLLDRLHCALRRERMRSRTDALTGLGNWRYFRDAAQMELKRAQRAQSPLTLAYVDLDDFKKINDTYGHTTGDDALCFVADVFRRALRTTDIYARVGGDEFLMLLPDTDEASAREVLTRLQALFEAPVLPGGKLLRFSIGAVAFQTPWLPLETMVQIADNFMYTVKRTGKGRFESRTHATDAAVLAPV